MFHSNYLLRPLIDCFKPFSCMTCLYWYARQIVKKVPVPSWNSFIKLQRHFTFLYFMVFYQWTYEVFVHVRGGKGGWGFHSLPLPLPLPLVFRQRQKYDVLEQVTRSVVKTVIDGQKQMKERWSKISFSQPRWHFEEIFSSTFCMVQIYLFMIVQLLLQN